MADVDALVAALTIEEEAALTAADFMSTVAIERLAIPKDLMHAIDLDVVAARESPHGQ